MYCPKCRTDTLVEMRSRTTGVRVDECSTCRGLWFDGGELEEAIDVASRDLSVLDGAPETPRVCPTCLVPMFAFEYPQTSVTVEMCERCRGVWLDRLELEQIDHHRRQLQESGELEEYAPNTGLKGTLIRFIDAARQVLTDSFVTDDD